MEKENKGGYRLTFTWKK